MSNVFTRVQCVPTCLMFPVYICRYILSAVASRTDKLNLSSRRLTDAELESVLRALPEHARYREVNLRGNRLRHWPRLSDFPQFEDVRVLDLSRNQLSEWEPRHIPSQVEELRVSNNQLTDLCDLTHCHRLRVLVLSDNKLRSLAGNRLPACVEGVRVDGNETVT